MNIVSPYAIPFQDRLLYIAWFVQPSIKGRYVVQVKRKTIGVKERDMRRSMRSPQPLPVHHVRDTVIVDSMLEWHGGF